MSDIGRLYRYVKTRTVAFGASRNGSYHGAVLEFTSNVKDDSLQAINDMIWDKQTILFTREPHVQLKSSGAEGAAGVITLCPNKFVSTIILWPKCPPYYVHMHARTHAHSHKTSIIITCSLTEYHSLLKNNYNVENPR